MRALIHCVKMSAPSPKPTRPRSTRIKRSTSPASAAVASKKKKTPAAETTVEPAAAEPVPPTVETPAATATPDVQTPLAAAPQLIAQPAAGVPTVPQRPVLPFKDPNFTHSSKGLAASRKSRVWKTLKQITSAERALPWKPDEATYSSIDAPPSLKPAKKYSDLSGFPAKYTDPQTKLRYADTEEFSRTRMLPADIVTGLLTLRKANPELQ